MGRPRSHVINQALKIEANRAEPREVVFDLAEVKGWQEAEEGRKVEEEYRSDRRSHLAEADAFRARRLAALEERLAAKRAEEDRAGVEILQLAIEVNWQATLDIEAEIRSLPVTFNATAALLLIDISYDAKRTSTVAMPDTALAAALRPLRFLRPVLTGEIATDVATLLDGREVSLSSLRFCAA